MGFFPACGADTRPEQVARVALQEVACPTPLIRRSRAIWRRFCAGRGGIRSVGTAGGRSARAAQAERRPAEQVFVPGRLAERLLAVMMAGWWPDQPPIQLHRTSSSLELAVARGARHYGLVRRGLGRRITGGAAHALYIGLEQAGAETPLALCVIPRGQEEGAQLDMAQREFQLTLRTAGSLSVVFVDLRPAGTRRRCRLGQRRHEPTAADSHRFEKRPFPARDHSVPSSRSTLTEIQRPRVMVRRQQRRPGAVAPRVRTARLRPGIHPYRHRLNAAPV
ncbi:MAG: hypothetical protein U1G07_10770 [Verrucomicrobiota bacterium]